MTIFDFIIPMVCILLLVLFDLYHVYNYLWCKRKFNCKRCGSWTCKHFSECYDRKSVVQVLKLCDYAGYRLSYKNCERWPVPDYFPEEYFPIDLIKDDVVLHFNCSEDFLDWANLSGYHLRDLNRAIIKASKLNKTKD